MNKNSNKGGSIGSVICFVLTALAFSYGIIIWSVNSGSHFFLAWFLIGLAFLCAGILRQTGLWWKMPAMSRWIRLIAALFVAVITLTWSRIIPHFIDRGKPGAEAVIVLGAQVRRSGPSTVLRYRLDSAVSYLQENPGTLCIVSGSQGPNEPFTEAEGMKTYLIKKGIPEDRILMEEKAKTTAENIEFSMKMLSSSDSLVVLVSNDFHMYRALSIAKCLGYTNITGRSAGSTRLFLPSNMLYESAAIVKNTVQGNMNTGDR